MPLQFCQSTWSGVSCLRRQLPRHRDMLGLVRQPIMLRLGSSAFRSTVPALKPRSLVTRSKTTEAAVSESFAKRNPFAFQVGVATVKTSAADLMTQVVAEKKVRVNEGA